MNSCLVTKLKSSINDSKLPYLGAVRVKAVSNNNGFIQLVSMDDAEVRIISDTVNIISVGGGVKVSNKIAVMESSNIPYPGITVDVNEGLVELLIFNKYAIKKMPIISTLNDGFASLDYMSKLENLQFQNKEETDSIENMPNLPSVSILWLATKGQGNVKSMLSKFDKTKLENINFLMENVIYDDFANTFGDCVGLTKIAVTSPVTTGRLEGSVEEFVKSQRSHGRTTCDSLTLFLRGGTYVTFNGASVQEQVEHTVSWSSNTITVGSVTISA